MTRFIAYTRSGRTFEVPASWCGAPVAHADDALQVARAVYFDRAVQRAFDAEGAGTPLDHDHGPAARASVASDPVVRVEEVAP